LWLDIHGGGNDCRSSAQIVFEFAFHSISLKHPIIWEESFMRARFVASSLMLILALVASSNVSAQMVRFELIPNALGANDMTPDGRYIVGETDTDGNGFPDGLYRWDRATGDFQMLNPNGLSAVAVSDDGSTIVGDIPDPTGVGSNVAALWTAATMDWMSLGFLPNAGACPSRSDGYECSADGSVVVGLSWDGCSGRGFRWTAKTEMIELENLANGNNRASVVSADGSLIGGFAQGSFSRTPCIWDGDGNGFLFEPNGDALGEVYGMNDAGTILLGTYGPNDLGPEAVMWTGSGVTWTRKTIANGSLLPGWVGIPEDIADDGTIVGFDFLLGNRRAWIQPQGIGDLIDFKTWVQDNGGTVPSGMILEVLQACSTDGRYMCGHGFGTGAWLVTILKPHLLAADLLTVTRGDLVSGAVEDLAESDNADVVLRRRTSDIQSRTEMVLKGFSPVHTPASIEIKLEGAVFARSPVQQSIAVYNYAFGMWEDVDTREASRFVDSVVTVQLTGDLTRFIEPGTNFMQARISFQSDNPRQQFTSNTDQFMWTINP
jgi:hypothetical protein